MWAEIAAGLALWFTGWGFIWWLIERDMRNR